MDAKTRAAYLTECPAFGIDPKTKEKGYDPEQTECVKCQELDPAMADACRDECNVEQDKEQTMQEQEAVEPVQEAAGSPRIDDLPENGSNKGQNDDGPAEADSEAVDLVKTASAIEWKGPGHYVLVADGDQMILRQTDAEGSDGIDLARKPRGMEKISIEKPKSKRGKFNVADAVVKLLMAGPIQAKNAIDQIEAEVGCTKGTAWNQVGAATAYGVRFGVLEKVGKEFRPVVKSAE